jgi:acetyltransferase-like isoleucine patch superfamily enzyme
MTRISAAVHANQAPEPDPAYEVGLGDMLRRTYSPRELLALYARFAAGADPFDALMRRCLWRAACRSCGDGLRVAEHVGFRNIETFEVGRGVFVGAHAYLQGCHDGRFALGDHVWIGPHSYFDARDLVLEDYVGWGPGAKVLGSAHTGLPANVPITRTDLVIRPVRVCAGADVGMNAVLLPGVTVGRNSIVGAGAVVTHDVPDNAVVAGTPARVLRYRDERAA